MKAILRQEFYNIRHVVAFIAVNLLFVNFLQAQGIPNITTKKQSKVVSLMLSHQQLDISFYLNNDITKILCNKPTIIKALFLDTKCYFNDHGVDVSALTLPFSFTVNIDHNSTIVILERETINEKSPNEAFNELQTILTSLKTYAFDYTDIRLDEWKQFINLN
jgi:hypothetical protein